MAEDPEGQLDVLRPILEWVVAEVRRGKSADVPRGIRPVLRFKKLSAPALRQVYRAVDSDDEFRERIAAKVTLACGDEIGRLWIQRPADWADQFDSLFAVETRRRDSIEAAGTEDDMERRARVAEAAATKAADDLALAESRLDEAESALGEEQAAHHSTKAALAQANEDLAVVEEQRAEAVRQLKKAEALAQRRLDDYRSLVDSGTLAVAAEAAAPDPVVDSAALRARLAQISATTAAAVAALSDVDGAVADAAELLDEANPRPDAPPDSPGGQTPNRQDAPVAAVRRMAAQLPGGLRDDGPEAAQHLVRVTGAVMLVDGYNQSMYRWSDSPIAVQRELLTQRLGSLAARTGITVDIVFDGDEPGTTAGRSHRGSGVRVRFSAADVEADDVIIELCDVYPTGRTVIVASDDRRVRSGAIAAGANVIGGAQLHGLLARS